MFELVVLSLGEKASEKTDCLSDCVSTGMQQSRVPMSQLTLP